MSADVRYALACRDDHQEVTRQRHDKLKSLLQKVEWEFDEVRVEALLSERGRPRPPSLE